jgi:hypothetical protein
MNAPSDSAPRETELARLAAYLLASARSLVDDPTRYGPFRLLDASRRALLVLAVDGALHPDLAAVLARLEETVCSKAEVDVPALFDSLCLQMDGALKSAEAGVAAAAS